MSIVITGFRDNSAVAFVTDWSFVCNVTAPADDCVCLFVRHKLSPVQARVTRGAREAGRVVLPVQRTQDPVQDWKMTQATSWLLHPPIILTQPTL